MKICNCWVVRASIGRNEYHRSVQYWIMNRMKRLFLKSRKKVNWNQRSFWSFSKYMYLIIIKSSFNYYRYIYSRLRCTRREPNCRNAFSLSLVANTTAVTAFTSIVSIIIISFALFILSPFLFSSVYVVVLAGTTTEFSSSFFSAEFFFSFFAGFFLLLLLSDANIVSYQQAHYSFDWLSGERTWWWTNISRHRTQNEKEEEEQREREKDTTVFLPFFAVIEVCSFWFSFSFFFFFFVITLLQTPSLFSFFLISIIFFFPRYFELDINRQFSSVNRMIIDADDHQRMITIRYHRIQIVFQEEKLKNH